MRNWAAVLGIVGGAASAAYWGLVPFTSSVTYVQGGFEAFYAVFVTLSVAGMIGGFAAGVSNRVAPALMALGIVPGIGALFLPGMLLAIAGLLALSPITPTTEQRKLVS